MAEPSTSPAETAAPEKATIAKLSIQLKKLNEANLKYKNLLILAKDRIQKQEDELSSLQREKSSLTERLEAEEREAAKHIALDESTNEKELGPDETAIIVRVRQRIKLADEQGVTWALMEMQVMSEDSLQKKRQYKEWMCFNTEAELQDFIRRDTGEPLTLPPYSMSPEESRAIQHEAELQVSKVTGEFRRFRVRSELARKQAESQIRDLQNTNAQKAAQQYNNGGAPAAVDQAASSQKQIERLKAEMAAQEAHWKESYDALLAENEALKSAGSDALLASQWRQRYENCMQEKKELEARLSSQSDRSIGDVSKYETKYRDLKGES
jgi:hypothetical protein